MTAAAPAVAGDPRKLSGTEVRIREALALAMERPRAAVLYASADHYRIEDAYGDAVNVLMGTSAEGWQAMPVDHAISFPNGSSVQFARVATRAEAIRFGSSEFARVVLDAVQLPEPAACQYLASRERAS